MHLEVKHLRLVDAIADQGSVTRAATRLHLTQSALSHQLREIEDRLGAQLFLRVNRRLVLSPAGQCVRDAAKAVLPQLERAEVDIGRLAANEDGMIRVSTACFTCYRWLPPLIKQFHVQYPKIAVEIVPEATRRTVDALISSEIDLALIYEKLRDRRLSFSEVFEDEIVVITSPDHPLAKKRIVDPGDLAEETVILHTAPAESLFAASLTEAHVTPKKYMTVTLTEAIVEMVRAGIGVSAVPRWIVRREIDDGYIAALRFTRRRLMRRWFAATLKTTRTAPSVSHFVELIRTSWLK